MQLPLQIVFHQLEPWPGAEALLRDRAAGLERFCPQLVSCRVVVEETQKHHRIGRPVAVRIDARLPGHELTVNRRHDSDFRVAVREAFDAMTRQLEDRMRRLQGQVKHHAPRTAPHPSEPAGPAEPVEGSEPEAAGAAAPPSR